MQKDRELDSAYDIQLSYIYTRIDINIISWGYLVLLIKPYRRINKPDNSTPKLAGFMKPKMADFITSKMAYLILAKWRI